MLQKHHLFRKIVCLLMAFALLLMQTGCGTQSEEIDSSKTTNETAASDPDAEEAKDKFVMLKEVYDILSGPLGEPYRTPEYWGGEEIDMMRVGDEYDDYLIGLRNVQNEMHYLLYEKDSDSIVEIDTEGKHIPWDRIYENSIHQEIYFYYFVIDSQTQMARRGCLTYSLLSHSLHDSGLGDPSLPRPEEQFEIPSLNFSEEDNIYTFDFLDGLLETLPEIYFTDQQGWSNFESSNICILNHKTYTLICLDAFVVKYYYLYQTFGTSHTITAINAPTTFWDTIRFQQNDQYLIFRSPTGQQLPNIYYSYADFPYITLIPPESPANSLKKRLPIWNQDTEQHYLLGTSECRDEWEAYHIWESEYEFCIAWDRNVSNFCVGDNCCPEIQVQSFPDRSITIWIKNGVLSSEAVQQLLNLQVTGIQNIQISSATLQEIEPLLEGKTKEELKEEGVCLSFTLEEQFQLYGEFSCTENLNHPEASLYFYTIKE